MYKLLERQMMSKYSQAQKVCRDEHACSSPADAAAKDTRYFSVELSACRGIRFCSCTSGDTGRRAVTEKASIAMRGPGELYMLLFWSVRKDQTLCMHNGS